MKLLAIAVAAVAVAAPSKAVQLSKTVQLSIVHVVRGCHGWYATRDLGPATAVKVARGGKVVVRVSCSMDFRLEQVRGPKLALGDPTLHAGTQRTFVFKARGVYVLRATSLQSSEEMGLQTLGADNVLRLTVTVP